MRAAPPVSVRCGAGVGWRSVQTALSALAAAVIGAWLAAWADAGPLEQAGIAAALSGIGGVGVWRASAEQACDLCWDGARWTADGRECSVGVMLDSVGMLLLRLQAPPGPDTATRGARARWLAIGAGEAAPAMHGLRAALYSRPPSGDPTSSVAGPATRKP